MDQERMQELLINYIDGNLEGELKEFVEKQINKSEAVKKEYEELSEVLSVMTMDVDLEPDHELKDQFEAHLRKELLGQEIKPKRQKQRSMPLMQLAAAIALVISGVFIGLWIRNDNVSKDDLLSLKREMEATKLIVMESLEDKTSASKRLMGVNAAYSAQDMDIDIINILVEIMNTDDNSNVRLAALDALAKFSHRPEVIQALIKALETQDDVMVQIVLINLMVQLEEKRAINNLKKIIEDQKSQETVKDEAHMAVFKLS